MALIKFQSLLFFKRARRKNIFHLNSILAKTRKNEKWDSEVMSSFVHRMMNEALHLCTEEYGKCQAIPGMLWVTSSEKKIEKKNVFRLSFWCHLERRKHDFIVSENYSRQFYFIWIGKCTCWSRVDLNNFIGTTRILPCAEARRLSR